MGKQQENLVCVVDVGSAKTCALVAEVTDAGLRYRGHGVAESRGSRKGLIVELDKAVASVQRAVELAEAVAECDVERATVGLGGAHIRGVSSRGGVALGSRPREITRDDVRDAVDKARAIQLPPDRQVLHLLPQSFILDEEPGVRDPAGMMGSKLEVNVHLITASASAAQTVVNALNRAGVHVEDVVFEALASADATLNNDERELGICVADIGAGSTDILVVHDGVVVHSGSLPVGGDHFTSDLAVGLRTPLADADYLKRHFGCAVVTRIPESNEIEVPSVGDRPSRLMHQRLLGEILEPRARELFELLRDNLRQGGVQEMCGAGTVLTGGGARLLGLNEVSEDVLRRPSRIASPTGLARSATVLLEPEFATVNGLAIHAQRARAARTPQVGSITSRFKAFFAKKGI